MLYTIELVRDAKYINLFFLGAPTIKELEASHTEVNDALVAYKWKKVLIESTGSKPKLSLYDHVKLMNKLLSILPTDVCIAIIHHWAFAVDDLFVEYLARNSGLNLKFFSCKDKALSWLRAN
jgi:hypothetical protein